MSPEAQIDPQQQKQWDALFKNLLPNASAIRSMVEDRLSLSRGDLGIAFQLPTDLPSATVAKALHQRSSYKELRGDGMFVAQRREIVVSNEYQSTHNPGMRLRFAMYLEAALEHNPALERSKFLNILFYSGRDAAEHYKEYHLEFKKGYLPYLIFDLNSTDRTALELGSVYDAIVRLSLPDANRADLFRAVISRIDGEVSDADLRSKLKAAVLAASLNKPGMWKIVSREVAMDPILAQELEGFAPYIAQEAIREERKRRIEFEKKYIESERMRLDAKRRMLEDIVTLKGGSEAFLEKIRSSNDAWIDRNAERIRTTALKGEISTVDKGLSP